jgi:hypothetical protein
MNENLRDLARETSNPYLDTPECKIKQALISRRKFSGTCQGGCKTNTNRR